MANIQLSKHLLKKRLIRRYHLPSTMKAFVLNNYANTVSELTPEIEFPCPQIKDMKANQALIKVHASSINPIDVDMTRGFASKSVNFLRLVGRTAEFPLILGRDYSGVIVAKGNKFKHFQEGDSIYGVRWILGHGTHAEYALVTNNEVCEKPKNFSHVDAASIAAVAGTVWYTLIKTGAVPVVGQQKRILIPGGAGGIGTVATQLCQALGHDVVTTCSSDAISLLNSLGVKNVIDYSSETYSDDLRSAGPFDVILGTLREEEKHLKFFQQYLKSGMSSRFISLQSSILADTDEQGLILGTALASYKLVRDTVGQLQAGKGLFLWGFSGPNCNVLNNMKDMFEEGKIRPVIDKTFDISDALNAYKYVEDGHARGKTVITMKDNSS